MSELSFYPAKISVALIVAGIVAYFTALSYLTCAVLLLAGVGLSALVAYRPAPQPERATSSAVGAALQPAIARYFRLTIGAAVIGLVAVVALRTLAHYQVAG